MPRKETVLRIFVASPGDVTEERAALEELVREFNSTWSRNLGVRLELVRWETDAVPGFGDDVQDVINRTMPDDYDIFIGVMWARFGTPTGRAGSGTAEEFERAYERFKGSPGSLEILLYFKDEPLQPSMIDPGQLGAVAAFKAKLGPLGGLYWTFNTTAEFQTFVRVHLSRLAQKWIGRESEKAVGQALPSPSSQAAIEHQAEVEDDEGLIDLIESANEALAKAHQVIERMTVAITELGSNITKRAEELQVARDRPGPQDLKAVKRIIQGAAEDLDGYVARTQVDIPVFAEQLGRGITAFGKAAILTKEIGGQSAEQLSEALTVLTTFREQLNSARAHMLTFRTSIASTPRMTTAFNHSKRRALEIIDSLLREYDTAAQLAQEVEKSLRGD